MRRRRDKVADDGGEPAGSHGQRWRQMKAPVRPGCAIAGRDRPQPSRQIFARMGAGA